MTPACTPAALSGQVQQLPAWGKLSARAAAGCPLGAAPQRCFYIAKGPWSLLLWLLVSHCYILFISYSFFTRQTGQLLRHVNTEYAEGIMLIFVLSSCVGGQRQLVWATYSAQEHSYICLRDINLSYGNFLLQQGRGGCGRTGNPQPASTTGWEWRGHQSRGGMTSMSYRQGLLSLL